MHKHTVNKTIMSFIMSLINLSNITSSYLKQIHPLSQSTIKHNVKSLITSPSKLPHSMPQLEAMERAKYEESKAVRHTSVVNSTTSVLRSTHQEAGKSQHSPGMYEDANARRTPVNYSSNPVSRGSPMLGRASEGICYVTISLTVVEELKVLDHYLFNTVILQL